MALGVATCGTGLVRAVPLLTRTASAGSLAFLGRCGTVPLDDDAVLQADVSFMVASCANFC